MDDTILMGHRLVQGEIYFKKCLTTFSKASVLEVNPEKYQIFLFNTPKGDIKEYQSHPLFLGGKSTLKVSRSPNSGGDD